MCIIYMCVCVYYLDLLTLRQDKTGFVKFLSMKIICQFKKLINSV